MSTVTQSCTHVCVCVCARARACVRVYMSPASVLMRAIPIDMMASTPGPTDDLNQSKDLFNPARTHAVLNHGPGWHNTAHINMGEVDESLWHHGSWASAHACEGAQLAMLRHEVLCYEAFGRSIVLLVLPDGVKAANGCCQ